MIPVVRLHPHGGFSVVSMVHDTAGAPAVIPGYHDSFATLTGAYDAAVREDLHGFGVRVHAECNQPTNSGRTA